MKIIVKAEKAGQSLAQLEYEGERQEKPHRAMAKALVRFCKKYPDVALLDDDVRVKFEKTE